MSVLMTANDFMDPLRPEIDRISLKDISTGLSNACRWGNQCPKFYSVAEHSVCVAQRVPQRHRLCALLHDAAEAYLGDVPAPYRDDVIIMIDGIATPYAVAESRLRDLIFARYGLGSGIPDEVDAADMEQREWEALNVMRGNHVGLMPMEAREAWVRAYRTAAMIRPFVGWRAVV